ncbi:MAG: hypothetical protein FGM24_01770 [Candidatus Kapabacteria bacterium]|nr:hypothetical protein [Candidatus Kapabacteria bacterium]
MAAAQGTMSKLRMIIDGGGTSTAVAVFDGTAERARVALPPYRPVGGALQTEALCHHLATWCAATAIPTDHVDSLVVGMAGVWTGEEKRAYAEAFRRDWEDETGSRSPRVTVLADIELLQLAALRGRSGIVLIAGTGSMALGVTTSGAIERCGGWGPRIDDAGGGFWIGREAVRAVAHMIDGTGPTTDLVRPVAAWLRVDAQDHAAVANRLRSTSIDGVARLAPAVFAYADEGDAVAERIARQASEELAKLVATIANRRTDIAPIVVRYGSLWHAVLLADTVESLIQANVANAVMESIDDVLASANAVLSAS